MTFELIIMLAALGIVLTILVLDLWSADVAMLIALAVVVVTGIVSVDDALRGFASPTLLALGSLYVMSAALRNTGALMIAGRVLFRGARGVRSLVLRVVVPVSVSSAFLNNTPIVAMGIPAIQTWCRDRDVSASKLLIPLSYASIVGGMSTLMGTSTNLVTDGLLRSNEMTGLGFFELAAIGVPCTVVGIVYLVFVAPMLLPDHGEDEPRGDESSHKLVRLDVVDDSGSSEVTVDSAALHELSGFHLEQIEHPDGDVVDAPEGDHPIAAGDRLHLRPTREPGARVPTATRHPGVRLSPTRVEEFAETDPDRELHTVVIADDSRLAGERLGDTEFLRRFDAIVTEVRRGGESLDGPLRDVALHAGDTLVLETGPGFRSAFDDEADFIITSKYEKGERRRAVAENQYTPRRMWGAAAVLVLVIVLAASGALHIAASALVGAIIVIVTGIVSPSVARESIDWNVLLVIGASLGLGEAMQTSGAADLVASGVITVAEQFGPVAILAAVVVVTVVLTEMITNNGAVALLFPVVLSVAAVAGVDPRPLVIGMTIAGSMAMLTPLGYQTNLMVYSAGSYRFVDFVRVGGPLQLTLIVVTVLLVPLFWSF